MTKIFMFAARRGALQDVTSPDYIALTAAEKADRLWSNCLADTSSAEAPSLFRTVASLVGESMCPTFHTPGDALPASRDSVDWKIIEF